MADAHPLLSVYVLARDEQHSLARCLKSVREIADEVVVVDTGSSDATPAIARRLGARVERCTWNEDFAAARNFALDQLTGRWVLWLDADEELAAADRCRVRPLLDHPGYEGYCFYTLHTAADRAGEQRLRTTGLRLWRNRPEYRYSGRVREEIRALTLPGAQVAYRPVLIIHHGELSKQRARRNLALLRRTLAADPDNPVRLYQLGNELMRLGRFGAAKGLYRGALGRLPASSAPDLMRRYAQILLHLGETEAALDIVRQGIAAFADYTDLHFLAGCLAWRQRDYQGALAALGRCLSLGQPSPGYPHVDGTGSYRARQTLGEIHYELGNLDRAVHQFDLALSDRPDWPLPLWHMLLCLRSTRAAEGVQQILDERFDWQPSARLVLAEMWTRLGEYQTALGTMTDLCCAGSADSLTARLLEGICLVALGRPGEALPRLEALCKHPRSGVRARLQRDLSRWLLGQGPLPRPGDADSTVALTLQLAELGRPAAAEAVRCSRPAREQAATALAVARGYLQHNHPAAAAALVREPGLAGSAEAGLLRAEIALAEGRPGAALQLGRRLLRDDPRCWPAWVRTVQALLAASLPVCGRGPDAADLQARLDALPIWFWRRGERRAAAPPSLLDSLRKSLYGQGRPHSGQRIMSVESNAERGGAS